MILKVVNVCIGILISVASIVSPSYAQLPSLTYVEISRSVNVERLSSPVSQNSFSVVMGEEVVNSGLGLFEASLDGPDYVSGDPSAAFTLLGLASAATQSTTIGFNSISGTGAFDGRSFSDPGLSLEFVDQGESSLSVIFDLSGPTQFSFTSSGNTDILLVEDGFNDVDPFEHLIAGSSSFLFGSTESSQTGTLEAGRYELIVNQDPLGLNSFGRPSVGRTNFEFDFQVEVVPEPSPLSFFLAITVTGFTRRRR